MTDRPPASRSFSFGDQERFAAASGDFNPIHMDPVAARRTQAGTCVVHGVHAALWALDVLVERGQVPASIAKLKVQFHKFIPVGQTVVLEVVSESPILTRANLLVVDEPVATLTIRNGPLAAAETALSESRVALDEGRPEVLSLAEVSERAGLLPGRGGEEIVRLFPQVDALLGPGRTEAIVLLSTLVGMVCPGLHSMFGGLDLTMTDETDDVTGLSFRVRSVDARFRLANIDVAGDGMRGSIAAFVRMPAIVQRSLRSLEGCVAGDEFEGVTALVVGGSRGLGALTARIIAAGGGRVIVTYRVGQAEAQEIAAEIGPEKCAVLPYDVRGDAGSQLSNVANVNQLYYFATPHITSQNRRIFDREVFDAFCRFYVEGFHSLCAALDKRATETITAFYPSTVFVENRPRGLTEYGMAKAAGELLCADISRYLTKVRVVARRLPRLLTDQTATVTPLETGDALESMLPIVKEMQNQGRWVPDDKAKSSADR